jgi:ATP-dependent Clp protease ATP-binding subunit ClpA
VTVEHLLIALLNMDEVVSFLRHKRVNIKEVYAELEEYIDSHTPRNRLHDFKTRNVIEFQ